MRTRLAVSVTRAATFRSRSRIVVNALIDRASTANTVSVQINDDDAGPAGFVVVSPDGHDVGRVAVLHPDDVTVVTEAFRAFEPPYAEHQVWRISARGAVVRFVVLHVPAGSPRPRASVAARGRWRPSLRIRLDWPLGRDQIDVPLVGGVGRPARGAPSFHRTT
jgi:hypothetical protein